jgi:NADPH2:quinone reductase
MKAATVEAFGGPEAVALRDWPDPVPATGQAVIAVEVAEVNYPDLLVVAGTYQVVPPLPFIPGKTAVGRVLAYGPGASGPPVGTRVIAAMERGAFCERATATAAVLAPVPDAVGAEQAAALGLAAQTAHFALAERARLAEGESVLVLGGSGAVGVAAIAIARGLGASRVIAAVRNDAGAAVAREAGADAVLRLDRPDLRDGLRADLAAAGGAVDVVLDPLGGEATEAALRCLAWGGRLVVVGFAGGGIPTIRANYLLVKNIAVLGLQWSDYRERQPAKVVAAWRAIFAMHEAGLLRPQIGSVLPLDRAGEALAAVAAGGGGMRRLLRISPAEPAAR